MVLLLPRATTEQRDCRIGGSAPPRAEPGSKRDENVVHVELIRDRQTPDLLPFDIAIRVVRADDAAYAQDFVQAPNDVLIAHHDLDGRVVPCLTTVDIAVAAQADAALAFDESCCPGEFDLRRGSHGSSAMM